MTKGEAFPKGDVLSSLAFIHPEVDLPGDAVSHNPEGLGSTATGPFDDRLGLFNGLRDKPFDFGVDHHHDVFEVVDRLSKILFRGLLSDGVDHQKQLSYSGRGLNDFSLGDGVGSGDSGTRSDSSHGKISGNCRHSSALAARYQRVVNCNIIILQVGRVKVCKDLYEKCN